METFQLLQLTYKLHILQAANHLQRSINGIISLHDNTHTK